MAIKHAMQMNRFMIPYLFVPWLITELIETSIYILRPREEYKPSVADSFCWLD